MKSLRITAAVLVSVLSIFYLLPVGIAIGRSRTNTGVIFVINLFLGWTLIGWVVALAWSIAKDDQVPKSIEEKKVIDDSIANLKSASNDFTKKALLIIGASIILAVVIYNQQKSSSVPVQVNTIQTTPEHIETAEEQQKRWDRGDFTATETAELKAEEQRENAALKQQSQ